MVNEVALVLLFGLFGWKVAALYMGTGLAVAMVSGWVIGRIGMERHVESWVCEIPDGDDAGAEEIRIAWNDRLKAGWEAAKDIVGKVWAYVLAGIAVGDGIIPVVQALPGKGAALGTVLAFMMSVIALSLPEFVILRKVLKVRLIATFAGIVGVGIMIVGSLFDILL